MIAKQERHPDVVYIRAAYAFLLSPHGLAEPVQLRLAEHARGTLPEPDHDLAVQLGHDPVVPVVLARALGMGLALAKKVVDLHHGRIEVESVRDEGSIFSVILPLNILVI